MNSDSPRPNVLLCFDFGVKKIGVAVGQTLTGTATPLETIPVRNRRPDWKRIAALLEQWRPQALIVGDPLQLDGSRQPVADQANRFANQLRGRYGLPVLRAEERLSTFEAQVRQGAKGQVDHVAAQVILEGWLQQNRPGSATMAGRGR